MSIINRLFSGSASEADSQIKRLNSRQWAEREKAAWILGTTFKTEAVEPLVERLRVEEMGMVRMHIADARGETGDSRAFEPLLAILQSDQDSAARSGAARGLGRLRDQRAVTPLIEALASETSSSTRIKIVEALGELGDPRALVPLDRAAFGKQVDYDYVKEAVRKIKGEVDVDRFLFDAAADGNTSEVKEMFETGADLDHTRAYRGETLTPLGVAVLNGHHDVVAILLECGADTGYSLRPEDRSPMAIAASKGDLESVRMLIAEDADVADVSVVDGKPVTPLMEASRNGHTGVVRELISSGAPVNEAPAEFTATGCAIVGGHIDVLEILIENGAKLNEKSEGGKTPIEYARLLEKDSVVDFLSKF